MARILLAEDEPAVRSFVTRALEGAGHHVTAVDHGGLALERLRHEPFDMLLTDIVMPVMDGISLALNVANEYPEMPVLMMSGYAAERQRAHHLDLIVADIISKPFTLDQIVAAVNRSLKVI